LRHQAAVQTNRIHSHPLKKKQSASKIYLALAATLVFLLIGRFYFQKQPVPAEVVQNNQPSEFIANLSEIAGQASIHRNGEQMVAEKGMGVVANDSIETLSGGSVLIAYADATQIKLKPQSALVFQRDSERGGKEVFLKLGKIEASIVRQAPGQEMKFKTMNAEAVVLGTELSLLASEKSSRLDVREGRVLLSRLEDKISVEVGANQYSFVQKGLALEAHNLSEREMRAIYQLSREEIDTFFENYALSDLKLPPNESLVFVYLIHPNPNVYGERPLYLKSEELDPSKLSSYDFKRLNPNYFEHLDYILKKAASKKIPIGLVVPVVRRLSADKNDQNDIKNLIVNLIRRYSNDLNIIWMLDQSDRKEGQEIMDLIRSVKPDFEIRGMEK
jgi:hypothetical protein